MYGANRKASEPFSMFLTSIDPLSPARPLLADIGVHGWLSVKTTEQRPWELFAKESIVILSPDASDVLDTVSTDKVR